MMNRRMLVATTIVALCAITVDSYAGRRCRRRCGYVPTNICRCITIPMIPEEKTGNEPSEPAAPFTATYEFECPDQPGVIQRTEGTAGDAATACEIARANADLVCEGHIPLFDPPCWISEESTGAPEVKSRAASTPGGKCIASITVRYQGGQVGVNHGIAANRNEAARNAIRFSIRLTERYGCIVGYRWHETKCLDAAK